MNNASQHVKDVSTADFQQEVLLRSREVPVLVDFWAEWCEPCKTLSPLLERLAEEADGAFDLAKVDVDANQEFASKFGVRNIPTVLIFDKGELVGRQVGVAPKNVYAEAIDALL